VGGGQISRRFSVRTGGPGSYAKFSVFLKQKTHFCGRKLKGNYGHKAVVLMSVVEGRAENICSS
jgi:hypothetical protein